MLKLAAERLTGVPIDAFHNAHMERGKLMEQEAYRYYEFVQDIDTQEVGLIVSGRTACSPDRLIGSDGVLEIKTKLPHLAIESLLRGDFPSVHKAQCQGILWIAEREWIDLAVYWPGLPMFTKRAYRDDAFIKCLSDAVTAFNDELDGVVSDICNAHERSGDLRALPDPQIYLSSSQI